MPRKMGIGLNLEVQRKSGVAIPVDIYLLPTFTDQGALITAVVKEVGSKAF